MTNPMLTLLLISLTINLLCIGLLLRLLISLRRHFRKIDNLKRQVDEFPVFTWSALSVHNAMSEMAPLPNWGPWAAPPDFMTILLRIVEIQRPQLVVEFGSGLSTVLVGSMLSKYGGKLISIEHDADYALIQQQEIRRSGLEDAVEVRVAPINIDAKIPPFDLPWYDMSVVKDLDSVDLVIVDGPPKAFGAEVRFPGIDLMVEKLSAGGTIILDDANRPGEQRIKEAIVKRYPQLSYDTPPTMRGCLVIRKQSQEQI